MNKCISDPGDRRSTSLKKCKRRYDGDASLKMGAQSLETLSTEGYIMKSLIFRLVEKIKQDYQATIARGCLANCSCSGCNGFLYHPVTSPCGHSFCEKCSRKPVVCVHCKQLFMLSNFRMNVTLSYVMEMLFPKKYSYFRLISEGDKFLQKSLPEKALSKYKQAILQAPEENAAVFERALAFSEVGNWEGALGDIVAMNLWCKYYSKNDHSVAQEHKDEFIGKIVQEFTEKISLLNLSNFPQLTNFTTPAKQTYPSAMRAESLPNMTSTSDEFHHVHINEEHILSGLENSLESMISTNISVLETTYGAATETHSKDENPDDLFEIVNGSDLSNFNCILCSRLLYDPVCTPCGHSFCRECLDRWFDHRLTCPMCQSEAVYFNQQSQRECYPLPSDSTLNILMQKCVPNLVKERELYQEEKLKIMRETVPIFVCTVSLPSIRCLLHVHEPRYRLMMRRVMKLHSGNFGMTMSSSTAPFCKYGTILNVKNLSLLPDGRSNIATIGTKRFEVVEFDKCDGYNTAKVKYIVDEPDTDEESRRKTAKMADETYARAKECFSKRSFHFKTITEMQYGKLPAQDQTEGDNGPHWAWWVLAMIPSNDKLKLHILRKTSFRQRLKLLNLLLKKFENMSVVHDLLIDDE